MNESLRKLKDHASSLVGSGDISNALATLYQVVEGDSRELGCLLKIGDLERKLDNTARAVAAYQRVASAYAEDGLLLKAIAVCKLILEIEPDHTSTQTQLAELYAQRRSTVPLRPVVNSIAPSSASSASSSFTSTMPSTSPFPSSSTRVGGPKVQQVRQFWPVAPQPNRSASPEPIPLTMRIKPYVTEDIVLPDEEIGRPHIPLFSQLPREAFVQLLTQMHMRVFQPGDVIIQQGEIGDSFFVLAAGRVLVSRKNEDGSVVRLAELNEGAFFGEMALLQDGARTASVVAEEECQIFEISKTVLGDVIGRHPMVASVLRDFYRHRMLVTAMATHPVFRPFSPEERRTIIERFKSKAFVAGQVLLEEGKRGPGLFLLLHGRLRVSKKQDGVDVELAELSTGDMFGEMSLLRNEPTVATVTAVTDCFVLRLGKPEFDELIMTHPQVLELVSSISEERSANNDILLGGSLLGEPRVLLV